MDIQKAAIFGAAGAIGQSVAPELDRCQIPFRVVGRSRTRLQAAFGHLKTAELFDANLADLKSATAAASGVDTIIYTLGLPYPEHSQHPVLIRTTIEAAIAAQVKRLVLVSSVYGYGVPRTARVAETHPRLPETRKGRYRKEQEDAVLDAHKRGQLNTLIVRLPDFYGPHATISLADMVFRAALQGKTTNWAGPANAPHEFVFVPDTGPVVVELARSAECYGEAWNFGGPGEISAIDFITRVYRAAGHAPKYRSVGRRMLQFLGIFSPLMRELPEMLYLQETPVILDDSKLLKRFPGTQKTPYEAGIRKTLEWMKSNPV